MVEFSTTKMGFAILGGYFFSDEEPTPLVRQKWFGQKVLLFPYRRTRLYL